MSYQFTWQQFSLNDWRRRQIGETKTHWIFYVCREQIWTTISNKLNWKFTKGIGWYYARNIFSTTVNSHHTGKNCSRKIEIYQIIPCNLLWVFSYSPLDEFKSRISLVECRQVLWTVTNIFPLFYFQQQLNRHLYNCIIDRKLSAEITFFDHPLPLEF